MKTLILFAALFLGQANSDPDYPLRVEVVFAHNMFGHGTGAGNINIIGQGSRYSGFTYRYASCPDSIYAAPDFKARWGGDHPKRLILLSAHGECTLDVITKPFVYMLDQNGKITTEVWHHQ